MTDTRLMTLSGAFQASDEAWETACERSRQVAEWGEQNHPDGVGTRLDADRSAHATEITKRAAAAGLVTWKMILREEVYEAFASTNDNELITELTQVAAVAQTWIEAIRRRQAKAGSDA